MKKVCMGSLLVVMTIIAIICNFNEFTFGGKALLLGFLLSIVYLVTWVFVFRDALKNKEYNLILPTIIFWSITCLTALVTLYVNVTEATISLIIPFAIMFLTPMYGLNYMGINNIILLVSIAIIASYFIFYS